jgi:hypothetical protein
MVLNSYATANQLKILSQSMPESTVNMSQPAFALLMAQNLEAGPGTTPSV